MSKLINSFIFIGFLFSNIMYTNAVKAEVCFSDDETVDIITLLDASERDLDYITSCDSLVKELFDKIEIRDKKIIVLTEELIKSKQDAIEYKASRDTWRRVVIYGGAAGVVIILIELVPLL